MPCRGGESWCHEMHANERNADFKLLGRGEYDAAAKHYEEEQIAMRKKMEMEVAKRKEEKALEQVKKAENEKMRAEERRDKIRRAQFKMKKLESKHFMELQKEEGVRADKLRENLGKMRTGTLNKLLGSKSSFEDNSGAEDEDEDIVTVLRGQFLKAHEDKRQATAAKILKENWMELQGMNFSLPDDLVEEETEPESEEEEVFEKSLTHPVLHKAPHLHAKKKAVKTATIAIISSSSSDEEEEKRKKKKKKKFHEATTSHPAAYTAGGTTERMCLHSKKT